MYVNSDAERQLPPRCSPLFVETHLDFNWTKLAVILFEFSLPVTVTESAEQYVVVSQLKSSHSFN